MNVNFILNDKLRKFIIISYFKLLCEFKLYLFIKLFKLNCFFKGKSILKINLLLFFI